MPATGILISNHPEGCVLPASNTSISFPLLPSHIHTNLYFAGSTFNRTIIAVPFFLLFQVQNEFENYEAFTEDR